MRGWGFLARAAIWIVALFGLLRLPWMQQNLLLPFADLQLGLACALTGAPDDAVIMNQSCTGSDALALCLGAILAYPASWRRRVIGCALGFAFISLLNTVRIGNLAWVVDRPDTFRLLHHYLWPTLLVVAAAGYVLLWMQRSERARSADAPAARVAPYGPATTWRFLGLAALLVALYYAAAPWFLDSDWLLGAARGTARVAAWLLAVLGVDAQASGNLLRTEHGSWIISGECVATPLLPIYLTGAFLFAGSARLRALALLAAIPLFLLLATARLLVIALPPWLVGSPAVAMHAFYQMLAAGIAVAFAVRLAGGPGREGGARRAAAAIGLGAALGIAVQAASHGWLGRALDWADPQGALVILPAFQIGLFAALLHALGRRLPGRRLGLAWAALLTAQLALVAALAAARQLSIETPVVVIRGFALAVPLALAWALVRASAAGAPEPRPAVAS